MLSKPEGVRSVDPRCRLLHGAGAERGPPVPPAAWCLCGAWTPGAACCMVLCGAWTPGGAWCCAERGPLDAACLVLVRSVDPWMLLAWCWCGSWTPGDAWCCAERGPLARPAWCLCGAWTPGGAWCLCGAWTPGCAWCCAERGPLAVRGAVRSVDPWVLLWCCAERGPLGAACRVLVRSVDPWVLLVGCCAERGPWRCVVLCGAWTPGGAWCCAERGPMGAACRVLVRSVGDVWADRRTSHHTGARCWWRRGLSGHRPACRWYIAGAGAEG